MKVKIPSPKSEFVKKAFVILVTGILPFSLIVNKQNEDSSKKKIIRNYFIRITMILFIVIL